MTVLTAENLSELNAGVSLPRYDRRRVTAGIVHIGVGGFHRSHQAMYIDTLMNNGAAMDWGICGVGLQPSNTTMRDVMAAQDGLYTLVLRHSDGTWEARVIGAIVGYLFAPDDPEAAIEKMAAPGTRIVSLTITEGGYNLDAVTGDFNSSDESVVADLRPGAIPRTVFGLVTEALARRRERGVPAFSILSCDNIQGNGHVSQRAFTAFARLRDPDLAGWMTRHVRFPNCMVNRITPQTTEPDRAELSRRFGIDDQWPVLCEPFTQWVLKDNFADGRPPLEDAGVQIVPDVEPYELMKLRLAQRQPSGPVLSGLPHNASDLIPKFLLPVIRQQLVSGGPFTRSAAVVASWARYAEGTDENGERHEMDDDLAPQLRAAAGRQRRDRTAFLEDNRSVFGELADDTRFTRVYSSILASLSERGVRRTFTDLDHYAAPSMAGPHPAGRERKSP